MNDILLIFFLLTLTTPMISVNFASFLPFFPAFFMPIKAFVVHYHPNPDDANKAETRVGFTFFVLISSE